MSGTDLGYQGMRQISLGVISDRLEQGRVGALAGDFRE
jgi:hypothetical protein